MFLSPILTSNRAFVRAGLLAGAVLFVGFGAWAGLAAAQTPDHSHIDEVLKGLNRGRSVGQVAVSPDGKRLAWLEFGKGGAEIRVAGLDDLTKSVRVTGSTKADERCREGQVVWSPDAKSLAFFSDCAAPGEQTDLYVAPADGGAAKRLTTLKGYVEAPAFLAGWDEGGVSLCRGGDAAGGCAGGDEAVVGGDWRGRGGDSAGGGGAGGCRRSRRRREFATPGNLHAYEFDWRPDSKGLAYVAADPPGENNWWVAKLYTQDLGGQCHADSCS